MRATNPTHVESIGTVISTKRARNKKRGRNGMSSNGGSQAATLNPLVRVSSVDLTSEHVQRRRDETRRHSLVKEVSVAGPN